MTKTKQPHPSLNGKRTINRNKDAMKREVKRNPGHIANRMKRSEMYGKYLQEKKARKRTERLQRQRDTEALGDEAPPKQQPRTLDNAREVEPTMVAERDPEIIADEADDEFAPYFADETRPKILVTTRPRPSKELFFFIADLQMLIPQLFFYPRKSYSVKEICTFATNRNFTHLMILSEKSKKCNGMTVSHLRQQEGHVSAGPTAYFKVTNVVTAQNLPNHGCKTNHIPELNLHGFNTRLGHRIGRFLGGLFPHNAEFQGRQVVTFHNQRDYIFVRHHRYIFHEGKEVLDEQKDKKKTKARLQELGPRFTLKLRWVQEGTFDTQFGEYEWIHKRKEMDTTRRRFHL